MRWFYSAFLVLIASCAQVRQDPHPDFMLLASAEAEQIKCVDTLAGAQYGEQLKHIPVEYGVRGFARKEFGDFFPVAKAELERGRPWVGANLLWSDTHTFGERDMPFVLKEAQRYQILCAQYPGKVEIAPFTEGNLKNPDPFLDRVKAAAPDCGIVNSVWRGGLSKKHKNEVHGTHAKPQGRYNFSDDGRNSVDTNVRATLEKHKDADVLCLWHPRLNLRWRDKDTANRAQRVREAKQRSPNGDMLLSLVHLFSDPGAISLPRGWLVKSHAEKHEASDQKGDKLLIIAPARVYRKGKVLPIVLKRDGQKLGQLNYYGAFEGGGYRYYAPQMGWKYGANAEVWMGKRKYGTINGGFRQGSYRE
jgi:hypothetical protein